ncbi:MAG: hypothetical protein KC657_15965 [Myxococcales bacterium]|nr:hypothetical protein [Myxococcales bacterium]
MLSLSRRVALATLGLVTAILPVSACDDSTTTPATPTTTTPDAGEVPSRCATPSGPGTTHAAAPTGNETWSAADSPHRITAAITIAAGTTLTLEPCAVVTIAPSVGVLVQGKLVAEGAADTPITIGPEDPAKGFTTIEARKGAEVRFSYVTVEGGGDPNGGRLTQAAMLDIRGDQDLAPQPIFRADHVTLKGSKSLGIWLREGGAFAPGSTDLRVTGGASFPMQVWGRAVGTVPSGTYTGNAIDEIHLPANGGRDDIQEDTTMRARGVPYRIGGSEGGVSFRVQGPSTPALTIEPGVTLRFAKDARLVVDTSTTNDPATGALVAQGTADAPIVFTSAAATPAAGDWVGIVFGRRPDPRSKISNAKVQYAGGPSQASSFDCPSPGVPGFGSEGAVLVLGGKPSSAFVTNTTIDTSASAGIVRGWTGDPIDFLATNTFTNVARCNETFPRPSVGVCPDPAPCPK